MRIGVAENLSLRGALIHTTEDVDRGVLLVLRLRAHTVGELVLTGRVLACERTASYRNTVRLKFAQQSSGQLRDLRRALRAFSERGRVLSVKSAFE